MGEDNSPTALQNQHSRLTSRPTAVFLIDNFVTIHIAESVNTITLKNLKFEYNSLRIPKKQSF